MPQPARLAGTILVWVIAIGAAAALAALSWVGLRGAIAADHLRSAQSSARQVVSQISDPTAVATAIAEVADDAAVAHALTSDPIWKAVEATPWVGPQLFAVSTVAASADEMARNALTPLAEVASTLSPTAFRPVDGRINTSGFIAVQDAAAKAASSMRGATDAVRQADSPALLAPLQGIVDEVVEVFTTTDRATDALARASVLVPAMLGAEGPRDYLVLFQNNAEWRSLGGIPGAMVLINTDNGSLELAASDAANNFARLDEPVLALDDEMTAIYGTHPARWMQNVTQVPDFSVSGPLAAAMWERKHDQQVDGVLALDPVTLSYMLEATGPVELPDGTTLTPDNAVSLLLNEVYFRYEDPADQDVFFSDASAAMFNALTNGPVDASALLGALTRAGEEDRVLLWSSHEEDQAVLDGTSLVGALPVTDEETTQFGVYLNDGTGSKMDFYQSIETTAEWTSCVRRPGGRATGTAALEVTITNDAPATGLPRYITAGGSFGVDPGSTSNVGYIYLPEGFDLVGAELSTGDGFGGAMHDGRRVMSFEVILAPGESATAFIQARNSRPTGASLDVRQTPTVNADVTPTVGTCL
jgi:hypothetical protein